jgi:hypothetical protein
VDDIAAVDDAILEDMVHCRYCGAPYDVSDMTLYGAVYDVSAGTLSGGMAICEDCCERFGRNPYALMVEIVRLREALDFYADPHLYADHFEHDPVDYERVSSVDIDEGKIARAALNPEGAPS